jgi:hypothetical protein
MPQLLTAEDQFCLLLVRGSFSPEAANRAFDALGAALRWDLLLERASTHGLIPLLYHRLHEFDFFGAPSPVRRKLKDTFGVNAIRNVLFTQELVHVLTELDAAGIPTIPLKGILLAESLYGDPALRTCADLDILISPKHLADSLQVLQSLGYDARCGNRTLVGLLARYGKDCVLMREDARQAYPLQVHCGLIWGGPAEQPLLAEIWQDAAPQPFHAAPAYAMSAEWEFLYLAVHAFRHGLYPFKWLVDLDWLIVRGAIDWRIVQEKVRRLGWERIVQSCFVACATLLETPVPGPFAGQLPALPAKIHICRPGPLEIPRETILALRLLPTDSARLKFVAIRLFVPTPADYDVLRLPPRLSFLYYLIRPWRLAIVVTLWSLGAGMARFRQMVRREPDR